METLVRNLVLIKKSHVYKVSNFPTSKLRKLITMVISEKLEPIKLKDDPGEFMIFDVVIPTDKVDVIKEKIKKIALEN